MELKNVKLLVPLPTASELEQLRKPLVEGFKDKRAGMAQTLPSRKCLPILNDWSHFDGNRLPVG